MTGMRNDETLRSLARAIAEGPERRRGSVKARWLW